MNEPQTFQSGSATLTIWRDRIRISKHGIGGLWQNRGPKGYDEFPISSIVSIAWRDATLVHEGYIQFSTVGGIDQRDAFRDSKAAVFGRRHQKEFERARAIVEDLRSAPERPPDGSSDPSDAIRKLKALHDDGLITDQEYERKRQELLDKL